MTEEFLRINPTGTVPALLDGDVALWDSHAIGIYLVTKYAKNDSLYPKDFIKRTRVNERLFFEVSYLFARLFEICVSFCFRHSNKNFSNIFRIRFAMDAKQQSAKIRSIE